MHYKALIDGKLFTSLFQFKIFCKKQKYTITLQKQYNFFLYKQTETKSSLILNSYYKLNINCKGKIVKNFLLNK